ncbi:MAG: ArsR/SmtB family transcription factor [Vulcanimicrobiaceae bacterium]
MLRDFKAEMFKLLAHPMRIGILDALRDGELTVGELQQRLAAEQSTVSQHLAMLRTGDFVQARREGTSVWYTVSDAGVWQLLDTARSIYERRLEKNHAMLDAPRPRP